MRSLVLLGLIACSGETLPPPLGDLSDASKDSSHDAATTIDAPVDEPVADASPDAACVPAVWKSSGSMATTYQIDALHSGEQPNDAISLPLCRRWSTAFKGKVSYPVIANGRLFVSVADLGSYGTNVYALDEATGNIVWGPTTLAATYFWSALAYDAGTIFALDFSGHVHALDAATGASLWTATMPNQYAFSSAPTSNGSSLYVGGAGVGGTVYAVNEADGGVLWTATVENGDQSSPAVDSSGVYVSYACDQAYAFDPKSGTQLWHHDSTCEGGGGKTVSVRGDRVYTRDSYAGNLVLSTADGSQLATHPSATVPAFYQSSTIVGVASGHVFARTLNGTALWSYGSNIVTAPIIVGSHVVVGTSNGEVDVLDVSSGALVSSDDIGATISGPDEQNVSSPLTGLGDADGTLIVVGDGIVVAY